uniref:Small EDRK-rich factor 2 n=1 Tax=Chinchilla lanigera TaxID=34839 RepID=A0A8C2V6C7_CHILA
MQGRWVQAPAPELSRGPRAGWVCRSFRAECLGGKRDAGSGLRGSSARVSRPASRERGLHAAPKPKFSSRVGATQRQTKRRPDRRSAPRGRAPPGGNQRELARQKNMKKQSDSVKGKRRDDGLSAAARKQRDSEIMQQKQKKANEKKEEPK